MTGVEAVSNNNTIRLLTMLKQDVQTMPSPPAKASRLLLSSDLNSHLQDVSGLLSIALSHFSLRGFNH